MNLCYRQAGYPEPKTSFAPSLGGQLPRNKSEKATRQTQLLVEHDPSLVTYLEVGSSSCELARN
jgi:hypothetical protein